MASPLQRQVAIVTGGARGIGAAIAATLACLGADVIIAGRDRKSLEETARKISASGSRCEGVPCDVTRLSEVESLAAFVQKNHGRADILVNNAGVGSFSSPLHQLPPEQWDQLLNTNLRGVFYCIRAFAPMMIAASSGHIINISSIASKNPLPNGAAYAASKWGLNGMSYSVAEELRSHNIRVSVICPGSTQTELDPHVGKNTNRMLQPEDIAHTVAMVVTQTSRSFVSELVIRPTLKP